VLYVTLLLIKMAGKYKISVFPIAKEKILQQSDNCHHCYLVVKSEV